jgi:hypothetical protein
MPRYKARQIIEVMNEWEVEAPDEFDAEVLVEGTAPDKTLTEQASFEITAIPDPPPEGNWTASGTFTITRHGTEKEARDEIKRALANVCDDFDIEELVL